MKTGRPTKFTPELGAAICELIMDGRSLPEICALEGMPSRRTVTRWIADDPTFGSECVRAREEQADYLDYRIQQVIDKAEDGYIAPDVARVVISGLQWRAAKLRPKRYGDKTFVAGDPENPVNALATRLDAAITSRSILAPDCSDLV